MTTEVQSVTAAAPTIRRLSAEYIAARALLDAATLDDAAPKILAAIGETLDWTHGALWVIDPELDALRCSHIWNAPSTECPEFDAISRATTFKRGVGLPGRVWETGKPFWIEDVVGDGNFPRAPMAARDGLHGAVAFPVILRGDVLSVMEFFSREIRRPDEQLLSTLRTVGQQIGMFTDRRRAQEELDRFFSLSLEMMCVAGFDGYFKRVNPAWQKVLGFAEEELLSRPYIEFVHPDDRDATAREAGRVSDGQNVVYFENRYLHKDGTHRWLLWAATPYVEQQVVYAAAHDITERKAAEETLAQYARDLEATHQELEQQATRLAQLVKELEVARRRAEDATEAKSAFLANMSHEIRTPLNAIVGMTALALRTRLTAEQREFLTTVKSSADALLGIINDVLDFSKIEARRLDLDRHEFELRDTVGDAVRLLALRAAQKGLELACHVAPDVPDVLLGDSGRLRQVLLNVLGNAVKFTERGEVVLSVDVEAATAEAVTLHFGIRDTGIGIPAAQQQQIFLAFTQADASTTRRFGGTGLGLAIASRLVDLMHGRLWVESTPGHGSTFHFTALFDRLHHAASPSPSASGRPALEGLRVLVVDDNETNRRILDDMLDGWHMNPTVVADSTAALAALQDAPPSGERFDVVISDGQMPDVDGFMLARRIKRDRRLRRTPIVMLTSAARPDDVVRCRRLGIDACLVKPVKQSDLLDALVTVFGVARRRKPKSQLRARPRRALRILLAEDNLVNRTLVTTLLRKRGHTVTAVDNGRAAVEAIARSPRGFDLALLDVQMPEMSGLEATQAIRDREGATGRRLPIAALTARAMEGDRERCFDAGMDAYLSKPIDVDDLVETVERLGAERGAAPRAVHKRNSTPSAAAVFDEQAALAFTGGDRRLLAEVVALFESDAPSYLRRLALGLKRRDRDVLRMAAHGLKGALATVGSPRGRELAAHVEEMGATGRFVEAKSGLARLRRHLAALAEAFESSGLAAPSATASTKRPRRTAPRRASRKRRSS
jgi:PAS domain S-box-containing protein